MTFQPCRMDADPDSCPVCRSPSIHAREAPGWGEWRRCTVCTLEFVAPLRLPELPETLYQSAYRGERYESRMREYHERLEQRRALRGDPSLWFWTPAYQLTIDWLQGRVGTGATTFEIGCALGFVLHTLRRQGFNPVGLDVAAMAVELNRQDGFRVWHGELASLPPDWVTPDAVLAFFLLHHLTDPVGLFRQVRDRWPQAPVAVVQYGPNMVAQGNVYSSPPRTLLRWNALALEAAFREAGYRATVQSLPSTGTEMAALNPLRRLLGWTTLLPPLHRVRMRLANHLLPRVVASASQPDWVLLAFAEPSPSPLPILGEGPLERASARINRLEMPMDRSSPGA